MTDTLSPILHPDITSFVMAEKGENNLNWIKRTFQTDVFCGYIVTGFVIDTNIYINRTPMEQAIWNPQRIDLQTGLLSIKKILFLSSDAVVVWLDISRYIIMMYTGGELGWQVEYSYTNGSYSREKYDMIRLSDSSFLSKTRDRTYLHS
jgi:hypothetical protein